MARSVRRPYLAAAGFGLLAVAAAPSLPALVQARALFNSQPIPPNQVLALAQPLAGNRWGLVLLEQRQASVPCWQNQADGTVLSMADGVRNETYCGRYASSGAYSLRVGGNDLSRPWQLKLEASNGQLELQATSPQTTSPIVVAQAPIPTGATAPNTLVPMELQTGWGLERRSYDGRLLSHIYVSNSDPLPLLLAKTRSGEPLLAMPSTPPPLAASSRTSRLDRLGRLSRGGRSSQSPLETNPASSTTNRTLGEAQPGEVIALQVVPFSE